MCACSPYRVVNAHSEQLSSFKSAQLTRVDMATGSTGAELRSRGNLMICCGLAGQQFISFVPRRCILASDAAAHCILPGDMLLLMLISLAF